MEMPEPATDLVADAPASGVPWARQPIAAAKRSTSRARRMVENLPDWEPMPPGELVVRRPRRY
ncbi:hypothetical protein [Micromonospora chalcea]|uniref:hypothetical protein n=1 Tax=Micromonospora chalcea TaxID=1874 RepID=UPI000CE440DA|nr:hypothetical protein [Micromonospora chalcea]PPA60730.1 hypothetical protein BAW75_10630 [Micromonospora chalcea]